MKETKQKILSIISDAVELKKITPIIERRIDITLSRFQKMASNSAVEEFKKSDEFLKIILECYFVGAKKKDRVVRKEEINMLKKHLLLKTLL